ncbi:hypothetical protein EBZ38_15535 [bacterium]|nr:hypothetical protein [bacterium]
MARAWLSRHKRSKRSICTVAILSTELDHMVVRQDTECVLQCPNVELQPARNTVQVTSTAPLQATSDVELQPALGYKALNWQVDHLEVR